MSTLIRTELSKNNFTDFVMKAKFGACMVKVYITLEEIDGK